MVQFRMLMTQSALVKRLRLRGIHGLHETPRSENARQRFTNCIRISTGNPWSPRIERAIATLGELAQGR